VAHDFADRGERKIRQPKALEQHLERAQLTFVRVLGGVHVEAKLARFGVIASRRHELETGPRVDPATDQPGAGHAIDVDVTPRDPGASRLDLFGSALPACRRGTGTLARKPGAELLLADAVDKTRPAHDGFAAVRADLSGQPLE